MSEDLAEAIGAALGSLTLVVDDDTLALVAIRGGSAGLASRWASFPLDSDLPVAECVRSSVPLLVVGSEEIARRFPTLEAPFGGDRSVFCLPLVSGTRTLGVIGLSFHGRWAAGEAEVMFVRLAADVCALTLDRIRAETASVDREAKLTFLAEAGAKLAGDLDYESTLSAVAEAAIPWFADWCTVALSEDGVLRTIAVAHAQPEHEELVAILQRQYPPGPEDGAYEVLRTGESRRVPDVTDDLLRGAARDEEHYRLMSQLGLRSGLSCALKVGDRTFGVISWLSGQAGRRFTAADQTFGETLAQRAGVAIDNAQLHSQIRTVAIELQRAVLPERLPAIPGWATAVRYLPSGRTDVGGDFYDVVALPDGRVATFVGDVMGRGVGAAQAMAQMRSAVRTLVAVDPSPAAVLSGMDLVFMTLGVDALMTMVYAVADPVRGHLEVINAGHPPALRLAAAGTVEALVGENTLLLGVGQETRAVTTVDFLEGDSVLLYTDGLVERRGEDLDAGTARLLQAAGRRSDGDAQAWLNDLVDQVRDPTRDDDVAALLLHRTSGGGHQTWPVTVVS